jgi:hypothetical protein
MRAAGIGREGVGEGICDVLCVCVWGGGDMGILKKGVVGPSGSLVLHGQH